MYVVILKAKGTYLYMLISLVISVNSYNTKYVHTEKLIHLRTVVYSIDGKKNVEDEI